MSVIKAMCARRTRHKFNCFLCNNCMSCSPYLPDNCFTEMKHFTSILHLTKAYIAAVTVIKIGEQVEFNAASCANFYGCVRTTSRNFKILRN